MNNRRDLENTQHYTRRKNMDSKTVRKERRKRNTYNTIKT